MTVSLADIEVGTQLPSLTVDPISRTALALFAGASGDHNPIHLDLDVAKSAGMNDVFAQGMLSMAYLGRLLTDWVPQQAIRSFEVRFVAITPIHGQPTLTGVVSAINEGHDAVDGSDGSDDSDGERRATVDLTATLADGTVTLTGVAVVALT